MSLILTATSKVTALALCCGALSGCATGEGNQQLLGAGLVRPSAVGSDTRSVGMRAARSEARWVPRPAGE